MSDKYLPTHPPFVPPSLVGKGGKILPSPACGGGAGGGGVSRHHDNQMVKGKNILAVVAHPDDAESFCCEQDVQGFIQEVKRSAEQAGKACGNRYAEAFPKVDQTQLWI